MSMLWSIGYSAPVTKNTQQSWSIRLMRMAPQSSMCMGGWLMLDQPVTQCMCWAQAAVERLLQQLVVVQNELLVANNGLGEPFRLSDHLGAAPGHTPQQPHPNGVTPMDRDWSAQLSLPAPRFQKFACSLSAHCSSSGAWTIDSSRAGWSVVGKRELRQRVLMGIIGAAHSPTILTPLYRDGWEHQPWAAAAWCLGVSLVFLMRKKHVPDMYGLALLVSTWAPASGIVHVQP